MPKSVLVTGAAGFIGANFVHYWARHHPEDSVVAYDALTYAGNRANLDALQANENFSFVHANICDYDQVLQVLSEYNIDTVVHFAAESHVDRSITGPDAFIETNVVGTHTLLKAAKAFWLSEDTPKPHRFHHVSTDEVYGSLGDTGLFEETTAYDPHSPYSASKASSDHMVRAYNDTYGMPIVISNCSNNYGPNQFPEKLLPLMINNIRHNKALPVYGKGENIRDWLWVKDHADAIDVIFHKGSNGETYNIGGNNEWKNIDLIHALCRIMDKKLDRVEGASSGLIEYVTDRAGHDLRYAIDANKIKNELGWEPSINFEEGLERTVDWYLSNKKWLDHVTSGSYKNYYQDQYSVR
jgi:dTDP-glucose 4,6-dehydratase